MPTFILGGRPREPMSKDYQIENLKQTLTIIESENIKLRARVRELENQEKQTKEANKYEVNR